MRISPINLNFRNIRKNTAFKTPSFQKDTFEKTANISFKGEQEDIRKDFLDAQYRNDGDRILELYQRSPKGIESIFRRSEAVSYEQKRRFDYLCKTHYSVFFTSTSGEYAPSLNIQLLGSAKPLAKTLKAIAQKNPDFFWNSAIVLMYLNDDCINALSTLISHAPDKVFDALESDCTDYDGDEKEHLLIESAKITKDRYKLFQKLMKIDPKRTSDILSNLPKERKEEYKKADDSQDGQIKKFRDITDKEKDVVKANERIAKFAQENPDDTFRALMSVDSSTGELLINKMVSSKTQNYFGALICLLLAEPDKFFDMAQKSNCFWYMARNSKQSYLDLFEESLLADPARTKDLLLKKQKDGLKFGDSSAIENLVANKGVDYTELLKAYYQLAPQEAFELFSSKAGKYDDTNLLTYYVNQKTYRAEDFITYLTNQNLMFVKRLLSPETLEKIRDFKYRAAMDKINKVEEKLGKQLTESEKRLWEAIKEVNAELLDFEKEQNELHWPTYAWLQSWIHNHTIKEDLHKWYVDDNNYPISKKKLLEMHPAHDYPTYLRRKRQGK